MRTVNNFAFDLQVLLVKFVNRLQRRGVDIGGVGFAGQRMVVPMDDNFGHMAVMFSNAQNHMCAVGSVQHGIDFFEMFVDVLFDGWGDGEVSACVFNFHPDSP
jgi:hypothetical protein